MRHRDNNWRHRVTLFAAIISIYLRDATVDWYSHHISLWHVSTLLQFLSGTPDLQFVCQIYNAVILRSCLHPYITCMMVPRAGFRSYQITYIFTCCHCHDAQPDKLFPLGQLVFMADGWVRKSATELEIKCFVCTQEAR